jgi:chromosome segregation ATPase
MWPETQADILEHRQEQIKAEETKLRSMQQQIERMEVDINKYLEEIAKLTEQNRVNNARLDESASLLRDRETLEDAVRKQHDLIEKQSEELKALKRQLEERDSSLEKAK